MNWSEMKESVREQMSRDPQRATLATRAWQAVEDGLRHLASVGHKFEIVPHGTLGELVQRLESGPNLPMPLSIADAVAQITAPPRAESNEFEARERLDA